jgi:DNA replication factor GINS
MAETVLEYLRRRLDSETQSDALIPLPNDFYSSISAYCQKLKRSAASGASEVAVHLVSTQAKMIESMVNQLLNLRIKKAMQKNALLQLLPEERYVCSAERRSKRRFQAFIDAVSEGRPSFIEFAHLSETQRNITVRFVKHVNELVGLDMRRYGPFETDDVASLPAASADILVAAGEAVEVQTRDEV